MAIASPLKTEPGARRRYSIISPATLKPIGQIEAHTAEDVRAAVQKARQSQPAWAALSFEQRGEYMLKALKILVDDQDHFIDVIAGEGPKARLDAVNIELFPACDALDYYARNTARFLATQKVDMHGPLSGVKQLYIMYKPLGVVGVISPWNGPFVLSIVPAIQALMAGNSVVVKPSSLTPMSGNLVGELFREAGIPEGVVTIILGDSETGQALLESGVDKISFTGSVPVGREVAKACAGRLIPCTLELGGKDPMIVCADANLDNAAGGAVAGRFSNNGQMCFGTERVYVVDAVADHFIGKVVERVTKLRQAVDGDFDVGALFSSNQMEILESHVADAVARGARVLVGGRRNPHLPGLFFQPTVIVNVDHDMLVMREETFGPVLPIMRVRDEDEAIRMANDTVFGLGANVWTNSTQKGLEIAKRINSGSVSINDMTITFGVPEAPFGGIKNSGIGRVNGETGLKGYCNTQPVIVDLLGGQVSADKYPATLQKARDMQEVIKSIWGT